MNMFRVLRADEIDCRISQIKEDNGEATGLTLLLYKDARCDQNILDEVVGPYFWKREHTRDNRNCIVSIWSNELQQWISKEDTGTESNTEKEKGLASDSFKRACFNWGIGRELYTAPFIWIPASKCNIRKNKYGKAACYDNFTVTDIDYLDGNICFLTIRNEKTGKECFRYGEKGKQAERSVEPDNEPSTPAPVEINRDAPANVSCVDKLPQVEKNPATEFLLTAMKEFREARNVTAAKNKEIFNAQKTALVEAGLAPDKATSEYTLEEMQSLVDAMWKNFAPRGTELKIG